MKHLLTTIAIWAAALTVGGCTSQEQGQIAAIPAQSQAKAYQVEAQQLLQQIFAMQQTYYASNRAYGSEFESIGIAIPGNAHYRFQLTARGTSWSCSATANLDLDATIDTWVVDQSGRITSATNDAVS
jgi:hypothetical protein